MTEKKQREENHIWTIVMMVLPVVILMNAGDELTDDSGMRILYAGVFGGLGGLIGFGVNFLTKGKGRGVKIVASVLLIVICGSIVRFLASKNEVDELPEIAWITQIIGEIEFDSPSTLSLQTDKVPEWAKEIYSEMKLYSDGGTEQNTSFLQAKILPDSMLVEEVFTKTLEGLLSTIDVDNDYTSLTIFTADEDEVAIMFSFDRNGQTTYGYGFMYAEGEMVESIWLMPVKKSFSKAYIEAFDIGIVPDYD